MAFPKLEKLEITRALYVESLDRRNCFHFRQSYLTKTPVFSDAGVPRDERDGIALIYLNWRVSPYLNALGSHRNSRCSPRRGNRWRTHAVHAEVESLARGGAVRVALLTEGLVSSFSFSL